MMEQRILTCSSLLTKLPINPWYDCCIIKLMSVVHSCESDVVLIQVMKKVVPDINYYEVTKM